MNEKQYVSVICEYNPFHFGHQYQIQTLKNRFDGVVCIMSGNIVQRGSVAVADKYLRAEAALKNGANLVLELPLPYCCSSARDFAAAGVHIAENIGVQHLAFGAENSIDEILKIDSVVSSSDFSENVKNLVETNKNISYPQALKTLVAEALGEEYAEMTEKPNNILALEYISALKDKSLKPFAVTRDNKFRSSSYIRSLEDGCKMLDELPKESKDVFCRELGRDFPRDIKRLDSFFIGTLRRMANQKTPDDVYSAPEDLVKKLLSLSVKVNSVDELVSACTDKIYTSARVRRALISLIFGITGARMREMPSYTCVLAADDIGREILKNAKNQSNIDIITKPVHALEASEKTGESFVFAKAIEDVISLSSPIPAPADAGKTPYIR